jgi:hypothetical protein
VRRSIFLFSYRIGLPIFFFLFYFVGPIFSPGPGRELPLEWLIRLLLVCLLALSYFSVTFLDQAPHKTIFLHPALWNRFGTFRNDQYLPYYDPSSLPYFYYWNGIKVAAVTSLLIFLITPFLMQIAGFWRSALALINFILLIVPYIVDYQTFFNQMYTSG